MFVNRQNELRFLYRQMENPPSIARAVLVVGGRGIGKSSLTAEALKATSRAAIKVRMLQIEDGTTENGIFIRRAARQMNLLQDEADSRLTLHRFLKDLPTAAIKKRYTSIIADEAKRSKLFGNLRAAMPIIERLTGTGRFSASRLFDSGNDEVSLICLDYLKYVTSRTPCVINIENVHQLDAVSIGLLLNLVEESRGSCFLFEYTRSDPGAPLGDDSKLASLLTGLKDAKVDVQLKQLTPLPFTDFLALLRKYPQENEKLLKRAYLQVGGNLRSLLDLEVQLETDSTEAERLLGKPTQVRLEKLGESERMILALIVSHQASLSYSLLQRLFGVSSLQGLRLPLVRVIDGLSQAKPQFIRLDGERVEVAHDNISAEVMNSSAFTKHLLLSQRLWSELYMHFYESQAFDEIDRKTVVVRLYHFLSHYDPPSLLPLLDEINRTVKTSLNPRSALLHLERLDEAVSPIDNTHQQARERVTLSLLEGYFEAGLFEEAKRALSRFEESSELRLVFEIAILDRLDQHTEALSAISATKFEELSDTAALSLRLIQMASLKSLGRFDECYEVYEHIESKRRQYSQTEVFGYYLRNAEIAVGYSRSIPYLREAISLFGRLSMPEEQGRVVLGLGMQLARLGFVEEAVEQFASAEKLLIERPLERHIVLNNRAAAILLSGKSNAGEAEGLLELALTTANTSFDKLTIITNLIIVHGMQNGESRAIIDRALGLAEAESQPDRRVWRSFYYNLATYCQDILGDFELAQQNFNLSTRSLATHDSYWEFRLHDQPLDDEDHRFLAAHDFHVGFLSYWHFTPPRSLARR